VGVTSGAGTAYPSGAPEVNPVFSDVRVCHFSFALSALRFPDSD